ncbi:MAG: methylated-DNA--[protein]-cysteine S-methyltransferase [Candidatus Muirbacterium halophilum]|nr:methylated-DNA--[protein]-cysteine S-methyltransferase [Candidatus Muirbacterium halophilum]MCK9474960.1 methylated-DNA--[protein]-cysteine S-methyltransferase [Candidatus Muirbacterium halophilum]
MKFLCKTKLGDFLAGFEHDYLISLEFPGDFAKSFIKFNYISGNIQKFEHELNNYIEGNKKYIDFPYKLINISDSKKFILEKLKDKVLYGKTLTYSELGNICNVKNPRIIGQAMKINPIPIVIPCHRVLSKNPLKKYYSPGVFYKDFLLELENSNKTKI